MNNSNSKTHKNTTLTFSLTSSEELVMNKLCKKILSKIFGLTSLEFESQNSESLLLMTKYPNLHGQCY